MVSPTTDSSEKRQVGIAGLASDLPGILDGIQADMLEAATVRRDARTLTVSTIDEAREAAQTGFARIPWATLGEEGEALLARDAITVRCIQTADGGVPASEDEPGTIAVVARAY